MRKEVGYEVMKLNDEISTFRMAVEVVGETEGLTLVYCRYTASCISVLNFMRQSGISQESSALYHGGLLEEEKDAVVARARSGQLKVLVSTMAFGLGVDLAQVAKVITVGKFDSLLDIAQLAGRAGRLEGRMSICSVLFSPDLIAKESRKERERTGGYEGFEEMVRMDREIFLQWIYNDDDCRLVAMSKFLHGVQSTCFVAGTLKCDCCRRAIANFTLYAFKISSEFIVLTRSTFLGPVAQKFLWPLLLFPVWL